MKVITIAVILSFVGTVARYVVDIWRSHKLIKQECALAHI